MANNSVNNYNLGYSDGLAASLNNTNVIYSIGHKHTSSNCYKTVLDHNGNWFWKENLWDTQANMTYTNYQCTGCGKIVSWYNSGKPSPCNCVTGSHLELNCEIDTENVIRTLSANDIEEGKSIDDYLAIDEQVIKVEISILGE